MIVRLLSIWKKDTQNLLHQRMLFVLIGYWLLCFVIKKKYGHDATNVGDEGDFASNIMVIMV
ncbi:putative phosphopyruvate hydratase [Helianthus annuus]|uniref:phosphopyruvate hydratase n=1 Tax=Helianthus annuus TaxID=4232 RepID=A0A9K3I9C9_HELAN|nr:putative phosphopyruvate hydratase [Helianthus annuus]